MSVREIITFQFGHYSNYIGTHWWNLQETNFSYDPSSSSDVNHDVLYREGETPKGQTTFTPRLLVADLKGALGHLPENSTLYNATQEFEENFALWDPSNIEVEQEPIIPKPKFIEQLDNPSVVEDYCGLELDKCINTWSDYLIPRFHPRTINIINDYRHECEQTPFNSFVQGQNLWNKDHFSEDFADRIRAYAEECDLLQGFQVLLDSDNGFGGLGTRCIQHLRDEYGKSIIAFPNSPYESKTPSAADLVNTVNTVLTWEQLQENSSLFSPLSVAKNNWPRTTDPRKFENLSYYANSKYQSSALLATSLDTLTLRYRRPNYPNVVLSDLCADLNKLGRKAVATSLSLPFPMTWKKDLIDVLDDFEGDLWTSLTPNCKIGLDKNMQSISLRGISEDRLKKPLAEAKNQISKLAYRCSSVHEMMTLYLACNCHATATYLSTITSGLKIKDPYPKIFNNNVTENGEIAEWPVGADVTSVPVMAGLHSGSGLSGMYESLYKEANRVKDIKKYHIFADSGLEQDEFKSALDHLLDGKELYEDHFV